MIDNELLSWQVGFMLMYTAFFITMMMVISDMIIRKRLRKDGILKTKRGIYTFTPNEGYKE